MTRFITFLRMLLIVLLWVCGIPFIGLGIVFGFILRAFKAGVNLETAIDKL